MTHRLRLSSLFVATTSLLSFAPFVHAATPPLVVRWGFDEQGGTIAIDALGGNKDGILSGTATRSEDIPTTGPTNKTSLSLDGKGYVTAGHVSFDKRSFTINTWLKMNDLGDEQTILSQKSFNMKDKSLRLGITPNGGVDFSFHKDGLNTLDNAISPRAWHNLSFTFDAKTLQRRIYIDGTMEATGTASGIYLGATGLTNIGRSDDGALGNRYWKGLIDEVRVYEGVLSDGDIMMLAQQTPWSESSSSSSSYAPSSRQSALLDQVATRRGVRKHVPSVSSSSTRMIDRPQFSARSSAASSARSTAVQNIAPAGSGRASSSSVAAVQLLSGAQYRVTSFQLRLRLDSRATSKVLRTFHEGDVITVFKVLDNEWAQVQTWDGVIGYVHAGFIKKVVQPQ